MKYLGQEFRKDRAGLPLLHDVWGLNREHMKARDWNELKALSDVWGVMLALS